MVRRIQTSFDETTPRFSMAAIGDSLTHNASLGVLTHEFWPERLAVALRALDVPIRARNFGHSGNTSTSMVARMAQMTRYDVPVIGVIWGGVNDPGNAIVGATTQANIQSMAETLFAAGAQYVIVCNTQYLNYSTGGDTVATPSATYATLRTFQLAAATALITANPGKVAYCDIYAYMRNLIATAVETQGSFSWHVADANQHLNALGNQYVADAMLATIQAQSGWLTALGAL